MSIVLVSQHEHVMHAVVFDAKDVMDAASFMDVLTAQNLGLVTGIGNSGTGAGFPARMFYVHLSRCTSNQMLTLPLLCQPSSAM